MELPIYAISHMALQTHIRQPEKACSRVDKLHIGYPSPLGAVVYLNVPSKFRLFSHIEGVYHGIGAQSRHGADMIDGDTTQAQAIRADSRPQGELYRGCRSRVRSARYAACE